MPWSRGARAFLAGNRRRAKSDEPPRPRSGESAKQLYLHDDASPIADRNSERAARRSVAPAQIALAWMLHKPGVTAPIIGASKMSHLEDAIAALEITLSEEEIKFLEEPYRPHAVLGHS